MSPQATSTRVTPAVQSPDLFHFDGYVVDRLRWSLRRQEEFVALSRKSFDLLVYLIERRDRVVSKDELLRELWPKQVVEESNLSQHVFLLRKAFSQHDPAAKVIQTVVGRGYRFVARLDDLPERQAATPSTRVANPRHATSAGIPVFAAIFALGVAVGHYWQNPDPRQAFRISMLPPSGIVRTPANAHRSAEETDPTSPLSKLDKL